MGLWYAELKCVAVISSRSGEVKRPLWVSTFSECVPHMLAILFLVSCFNDHNKMRDGQKTT